MTAHSRSFHHCVVLGTGAVGRMLLGQLPADVTILDAFDVNPTEGVRRGDALNMSQELRTALCAADLVVLALPEAAILAALPDVIRQVSSNCLIVETGSVKTPVAATLAHGRVHREVVGINPMFAPSLGMADQSVAVVDYTDGVHAETFRQCIARWGARAVTVSAARHDEIASITQAALHSILLAFGAMVADHEADWPQLRLLATPPFRAMLLLVARVFAQNPTTYWDIQASNPAAASSRRRLLESLERTHALICDPDGAAQFEEWFRSIAVSFGPSLDALRQQSDAVLKGIPRYRC